MQLVSNIFMKIVSLDSAYRDSSIHFDSHNKSDKITEIEDRS